MQVQADLSRQIKKTVADMTSQVAFGRDNLEEPNRGSFEGPMEQCGALYPALAGLTEVLGPIEFLDLFG